MLSSTLHISFYKFVGSGHSGGPSGDGPLEPPSPGGGPLGEGDGLIEPPSEPPGPIGSYPT